MNFQGNSQTLTGTPYHTQSSSPGYLPILFVTENICIHPMEDGSVPLQLVIGKIHYDQGHGVSSYAWKMIQPQAMEFFVLNNIFTSIGSLHMKLSTCKD